MKRILPLVLTVSLAVLLVASSAQAAVTLTFTTAVHEQAQITRGDEVVTYMVKVKNSGSEPTSGKTSVAIALPVGAELSGGSGEGWVCDFATQTCSSGQSIVPGAEFPQLRMRVWLYPEAIADTVVAGFTATGGGATTPAIASDSFTLGPEKLFAIENFGARAINLLDEDDTRAGGHPYAATSRLDIPLHTSPIGLPLPVESLRDLYFELPAGFIANPETATMCTFVGVQQATCPDSAIVGGVKAIVVDGFEDPPSPLYRIVPENGYPAAFAFRPVAISSLTFVLRAKLRANGDYGVTAVSPLAPQNPAFLQLESATLCGYGSILKPLQAGSNPAFLGCKKPGESGARETPLLTNPTKCAGEPPVTRAHIDSYQNIGAQSAEGFPELSDSNWKSAVAVAPQTEGCEALTEAWASGGASSPSFSFRPDSSQAATPAVYTAHLHIPQNGLLEEDGLATSHLKDTSVLLPQGVILNPAAADGLRACSEAEAGYLGGGFAPPNPMRFSTVSPGCPDAAKIGTVEVTTPILADPLDGSIYLAAQGANPFGSDFATYLVIDDEKTGIKATLAGRVEPDQGTGQITATFLNNPQVPVEDLEVSFFGGPRASLATPDVCAPYTTRTELTPWSAADPDNPTAEEIALSTDVVMIDSPAPGQATCPTSKAARPFNVGLAAKSTEPIAGAHAPFTLRLTRPDGAQELTGVTVTTPPGFAATLQSVEICSDASLARAQARTATGDGAKEIASPSCPASSQIGTTTIGAGVGSQPFYVKTGKVYLTGPYKGAPISLAFIVPAVAGPFDLGVQVVRTALNVDPKTAQITAVSDPIPQILEGVPLQIRDVVVDLDRPGFSFNPTNCEEMAINAQVTGSSGAVANLANRFQVGGCEKLGFKPDIKLQLHGGTKRGDYQRVVATVTARPGDANIARAAVTFPHSAFLAQEHLDKICTRVQFAAKVCPAGSVYGYARATTPLLDEPVQGPVYLRSNPDHEIPDLVAALRGPDRIPVEVELQGRTDSKNEGIRNTFDIVPDLPVTKFTMQIKGGNHALIVNSRNLCKGRKQRATVRLRGQNGMQRNFRTVVGNDCGKRRK